jgi:two-component system LytT family response regulator
VTSRLRAFLVDDEPLAIERLSRLLRATGRVDIAGHATDPETALAELTIQAMDVVFLDIQMPELNGFQLVERLVSSSAAHTPAPPSLPAIVFVTAHDEHAIRAFEINAVDYLLKPVERRRLDRTLDRVERRRDDPSRGDLMTSLTRLAQSLRPRAFVERLPLRQGERVQFLDVGDITHVIAKDRATYAVTAGGGSHLLDDTIAELERKLDLARFFRIHRGALVNVDCIGELHADIGGRLVIRLKGQPRSELVVARDRVRALKDRLGL